MFIKSVDIQNTFGIKKLKLDFWVKNASKDSSLQDQLIKDEKKFYSLTPSFLGKNASGKTSFIKAINFALRFGEFESIKKELLFYFNWLQILNQHKNIGHNIQFEDTNELFFKEQEYGKLIASKIFTEISFVGSKDLYVNLNQKNGLLKVELTPESFFVVINNEKINIINIIDSYDFSQVNKMTFLEQKKSYIKHIDNYLKQYKLFNYKFNSIFRADHPAIRIGEISQKYKANKHLNGLLDVLGAKTLKLLLKKIDKNIETISQNISKKEFEIFLNAEPNINISASSLSFGTQKVLEILYKSIPIFKNGGIMLIDEIENGLHLSLIDLIVSIYKDKKINIGKGQLFITTHNPLIFKREIINIFNIYMEENHTFINIGDYDFVNRTEIKNKIINPINYYNSLFWVGNNTNDKNTISYFAISQIVEAMANGVKWQKK